jgi:hypothetical protein
LEGWKLQLVPEFAAIEGIAKQIRSRAKAYPLFELARLIVQLSDRYTVRLQAENEETSELFRVKTDGSLWQTRKEAVAHLLSKHLGKFYRKSSITTEAPKGAFSVVAQCGMSGVLLGPPNHHEYTSRLIGLHSERFKNMPFEVYKARIKMMRDEALIEQWKTEQSTKTIYIPVTEEAAVETSEEVVAPTESPEAVETTETPVEIPSEVPAESVVKSIEETTPEVSAEAIDAPAEQSSETPVETSTEESTAGESSSATEDAKVEQGSEGAEGLTWEQVSKHFNEQHADHEIESSGRDITLAGGIALHGSTPLLRELLLKNLQEMDHFPLPLAQLLGKELTNRGLQLFKSHKKIINVSMARPRYLDRETTPIGESFRSILEYLEAHPKQHRDKQWAALLALRTETADQPIPENTAIATPSVSELAPETEVSEQQAAEIPHETSAATTTSELEKADKPAKAESVKPTIDAETLKRREQALGADLLWLLHQGHVIDFAMGNLQAATRPVPKTPATPSAPAEKKQKAEKTEPAEKTQSMDETLTGDTGDVQHGCAADTPTASEEQQDVIHEPVVHHEPLEIPEGTVIAPPPPSELGDPGAALPN